MCYSSFHEGVFQNQLKLAKVTPVFKSCDNSDVGSYRPTSVVVVFVKVLKKVMHNIIDSYFKSNELVFEKQFGFFFFFLKNLNRTGNFEVCSK